MTEQQQPNEITEVQDESQSNVNEDPADLGLRDGVPNQKILDRWKVVGHGLETKGTGESFAIDYRSNLMTLIQKKNSLIH